ncbi:Uncharacterized protein ALO81_02648, partial [Pseudomonas cannabina]
SAMGCEAALIQTTSVVPDVPYAPVYCRYPAVRGQVRSYKNREIADKRNVARSAATQRVSARRAWERTRPRWAAK